MKHQVTDHHQVRTRPKVKIDWFTIKDVEWALAVSKDEDCLRFIGLLLAGIRPSEILEPSDITSSNCCPIGVNLPIPSR